MIFPSIMGSWNGPRIVRSLAAWRLDAASDMACRATGCMFPPYKRLPRMTQGPRSGTREGVVMLVRHVAVSYLTFIAQYCIDR